MAWLWTRLWSEDQLWKPSGAVSDVTLRDLLAEGTFLAMQKEIRGLTAVVQVRFLPRMWREWPAHHWHTRWVTNEKEKAQEGLRARIVAKDFASRVKTRERRGSSFHSSDLSQTTQV